MEAQQQSLFFNGKWHQGEGMDLVVREPTEDRVLWEGRAATLSQIDHAVEGASLTATSWRDVSFDNRKRILHRFVDLVKRDSDRLAHLIASEVGKPLWEAKTEVSAIIGKLEPTIESIIIRNKEISKDISGGDVRVRTEFYPIGTVAVIGPYNFPLHIPNGHIMPALLSGNCVIFKPSELAITPSLHYCRLLIESGLPAGVFSLIQGDGTIGRAISQHKGVNGVFFTGSTETGRLIESDCAERKAICALEMGGDGAIIVDDYEDLEGAALTLIQSCFATSGQRCSGARKIIFMDDLAGEKIIKKFVELAKLIRVGSPFDEPAPYYGPMRTLPLAEKSLELQSHAISRRNDIILESTVAGCKGKLLRPGVFMMDEDWVMEEIAGPVIRIQTVKNLEEAVTNLKRSSYGLAAGLISKDKSKFEFVKDNTHFGNINWNSPLTGNSAWGSFGGTRNSGNYRPSGFLAIDYCVYAKCSMERSSTPIPSSLPSGIHQL